jgi:hypothetical protein
MGRVKGGDLDVMEERRAPERFGPPERQLAGVAPGADEEGLGRDVFGDQVGARRIERRSRMRGETAEKISASTVRKRYGRRLTSKATSFVMAFRSPAARAEPPDAPAPLSPLASVSFPADPCRVRREAAALPGSKCVPALRYNAGRGPAPVS